MLSGRLAIEGKQRLDRGAAVNARLDGPAPLGIKAGARHVELHADAQAFHPIAPGCREEVKARAQGDVRSTLDGEPCLVAGQSQRQVDRLQHEAGGTGRADRKPIVPGADLSRMKFQGSARHLCAVHLGAADLGRSRYAAQMLRPQARLVPLGADVFNAQCPSGQQRQGQAAAQYLPSPFADRAVQLDELRHKHTFFRRGAPSNAGAASNLRTRVCVVYPKA
jgi:hypothetical protein